MIKIEINAENGADARKELIDLLGLNNSGNLKATLNSQDLQLVLNRTVSSAENQQPSQAEETTEQTPEPEKKKRRTKAEIEAEAAKANTGSEEPPATEVEKSKNIFERKLEEIKTPEPTAEFPTLRDVQILSGTLVRAGYKDKAIELVKTVGKAESTPAVAEENRQALIDAFKQLAADNKIALPE